MVNSFIYSLIKVPDPALESSSNKIEWFKRPSIMQTPLTPLLATSKQLLILGIIPPEIVSLSINSLIDSLFNYGISFLLLSKTPSTSLIIISLLANFIYFGNGSEFKLDIQFQNILKFVLISVVVILLNAASDLRKIKKRSFFEYFYLIIVFAGVYILSIPISVIVLLNIFVGLIITKVQRKF